MRLLLLLLIVSSIISINAAWRNFLRGRSRYGNLGEPVLLSKTYSLPTEQWFLQHLDHFNPVDARVWKQVISYTIKSSKASFIKFIRIKQLFHYRDTL